MAYTRWGAIGEQAGAGLASGLDMALKQKMKQKQIDDFAKQYKLNPKIVALSTLGLQPIGGKSNSLQDQILYSVLKSNPQFANLQMPSSSNSGLTGYEAYFAQPDSVSSNQPPILNTVATGNGQQPSGDQPGQVIGGGQPASKQTGTQYLVQKDTQLINSLKSQLQQGEILVRNKNGEYVGLPSNEFDPNLYERIE